MVEVAPSLSVQKGAVAGSQMEPVVNRFVVEESRPETAQENGRRQQAPGQHEKKPEEQSRDRKAEAETHEKVVRVHRFGVMDEVEFLANFLERSVG